MKARFYKQGIRGFTILELLVVVAIIGLMAAMALPHLGGFTKSNTVAAATQQLLDDVNLARQRAMATRSTVYMVFIPTNFWTPLLTGPDIYNLKNNAVVSNLVAHQAAAYAIVSLRSVGDQPGRSYPRYLSDWKTLPDGAFIAPYKFFTNATTSVPVYSTNTLSPQPNFIVSTNYPFAQITVPFPSVTVTGGANNLTLPAIGFTASGGLVTYGNIKNDEYIPIDLGTIIYKTGPNGGPAAIKDQQSPTIVETPPNNWISNPNLIHISWLTGRAKVERNQF